MAHKYRDRVRETTITTGTGDLQLAGAVDATYNTFASFMSNGDTTDVRIQIGSSWETVKVTYNSGPNTLTRATPYESTNGGAAVSFGAGLKDVVCDLPAKRAVAFDSGVLMLFQQTAAPIGWTKQTTHNDKALRVVSGTASSGGSSPFSTVFGKTATDATTLSAAQQASMPVATTDSVTVSVSGSGSSDGLGVRRTGNAALGWTSGSGSVPLDQGSDPVSVSASGSGTGTGTGTATGSGGSHTHPIDLRVNYVDLIIASKD